MRGNYPILRPPYTNVRVCLADTDICVIAVPREHKSRLLNLCHPGPDIARHNIRIRKAGKAADSLFGSQVS